MNLKNIVVKKLNKICTELNSADNSTNFKLDDYGKYGKIKYCENQDVITVEYDPLTLNTINNYYKELPSDLRRTVRDGICQLYDVYGEQETQLYYIKISVGKVGLTGCDYVNYQLDNKKYVLSTDSETLGYQTLFTMAEIDKMVEDGVILEGRFELIEYSTEVVKDD